MLTDKRIQEILKDRKIKKDEIESLLLEIQEYRARTNLISNIKQDLENQKLWLDRLCLLLEALNSHIEGQNENDQ